MLILYALLALYALEIVGAVVLIVIALASRRRRRVFTNAG
jgi:hypothetical protein